jgi:hypothetical protein
MVAAWQAMTGTLELRKRGTRGIMRHAAYREEPVRYRAAQAGAMERYGGGGRKNIVREREKDGLAHKLRGIGTRI